MFTTTKQRIVSLGAMFGALMAVGSVAQATLVTSLPGGTVIPMPAINYFGPGPQTFGSGEVWFSTNVTNQGGSVFGYTGDYGFGSNGIWNGALGPMAGLNDSFDAYGFTDTMTFSFPNPVAGVGGFLNYVPGGSTPTTIAVYDSGDNLIESATLTFLTGSSVNTGQFLGFLQNSAIISKFTLTDNYIGITNLTTVTESVPEPTTLALLGLGMAGLAFVRRRRNAAC